MEHSVIVGIRAAIEDVLSNRGGKWVGEFVVVNAGDHVTPPNMSVFDVINEMVADNTLEKTYQVVNDKMHRTVRLPLYRLAPNYTW
jgi:hypothetical protein